MAIDPYWKDRERYSSLEIAYLACGEEPKNLNQSQQEAPQKVINCFKAIWRYCVEEGVATKSEKFSDRYFQKQEAIELIDYFGTSGLTNFLKFTDNQPISNNDRQKLLKQIGALALLLAEKSNKYKRSEKPNANQIASDVELIFDAFEFVDKKGVGKSELRESIAKGVKLLLDE